MPNNEDAFADDFLGNQNPENKEFEENKDPFAVDSEKTPDIQEDEPKEEEKLPFHLDPKMKRYVEKQVEKALKEKIPKSEEETFKKEVKIESDDDFLARLIGNDTLEKQAMIREYKTREERLLKEAEERAYQRIEQEKLREIEAERKADEQLSNSIEEIETTYNVDLTSKDPIARKARVDFLNFVEKIAPKDEYGEIIDFPDMISAYETFSEMKKSSPDKSRAKELASRSMARSGDSQPKPQERITFDNIDSFLERLKK